MYRIRYGKALNIGFKISNLCNTFLNFDYFIKINYYHPVFIDVYKL